MQKLTRVRAHVRRGRIVREHRRLVKASAKVVAAGKGGKSLLGQFGSVYRTVNIYHLPGVGWASSAGGKIHRTKKDAMAAVKRSARRMMKRHGVGAGFTTVTWHT